jgi:hypothetical protein
MVTCAARHVIDQREAGTCDQQVAVYMYEHMRAIILSGHPECSSAEHGWGATITCSHAIAHSRTAWLHHTQHTTP